MPYFKRLAKGLAGLHAGGGASFASSAAIDPLLRLADPTSRLKRGAFSTANARRFGRPVSKRQAAEQGLHSVERDV